MAPARQDCGKNLIKLVWQGAGHEVIDLGANLKPKAWLKALKQRNVSALAASPSSSNLFDLTRTENLSKMNKNQRSIQ